MMEDISAGPFFVRGFELAQEGERYRLSLRYASKIGDSYKKASFISDEQGIADSLVKLIQHIRDDSRPSDLESIHYVSIEG